MKNYYEILEVNKRASKEVIENAYSVLKKRFYSDNNLSNKNLDKKIKEINEAYQILSNDFYREQYDLELEKEETKKVINEKEREDLNEKISKYKIGSFSRLFELLKHLFKKRRRRKKIKEITQKDILAMILTIVVIIIIGIALWFIPFTNGWMRELLFENPLFNAIGSLFSR